MKCKSSEEDKIFNDSYNSEVIQLKRKNLNVVVMKSNNLIFICAITLINIILLIYNLFYKKKVILKDTGNINLENRVYNKTENLSFPEYLQELTKKEIQRPILREINKKRIFEKRIPLSKDINCRPHFSETELVAFLSFLTNETIFFETGSGCSSVIAKYYTKKSYSIEGSKEWYEQGIKNGLRDNLIFRDLKPDNPIWSYPGKNSTLSDWKKYFQSYEKEYNADVILLDGRFKIATAMDIFEKIKNDTVIFIHEYPNRPIYFILENYYQYIYHWGSLTAFIKKNNVHSIPLQIQKKYWNIFL